MCAGFEAYKLINSSLFLHNSIFVCKRSTLISIDGLTSAACIVASSKAALEAYYQQHAAHFQAEESQRFADKMLAFRTELEWIDEFTLTPH